MTDHPGFAAMDETQARQARELPSREQQLGTIWRVAQAAVLYVRFQGDDDWPAFQNLCEAVADWERANPESAARLEGE